MVQHYGTIITSDGLPIFKFWAPCFQRLYSGDHILWSYIETKVGRLMSVALMWRQRDAVKRNLMSQEVVIARIKTCVMGLAHIQRKGNYPGGRLVEYGCT
ncbi:hypothetical protein CY35_09G028600 [Sphagnum magellanicum]|nr:hypothetical protein CY35_09G028600 [Sphagnum magellanicum]